MTKILRIPLIIAAVGILLVSMTIGALALTINTETEPDRGGVFTEGVVGSPLSINPILADFNDVDRDLVALLFDGLVKINERGEPVPELAASWNISNDGKIVTVAMRHDAYWHDGTPVGARDVVFTIKAIQDPKFQGAPDLAETWKGITVEQLDDYTVKFTLRDAFAPFISNLAIGLLPSHLLKDVPAEALPDHPFRANPVGTGPFKMGEASADSVTLEANTGYYGAKPYLKIIKFRFYETRQDLLNAIKLREVQGAAGVTQADIGQLDKSKDFEVLTAPRASFTILFLNNKSQFFKDKQVRLALAYALNRKKIIDVAAGGLGMIDDSPVPPGTWSADAILQKYPLAPEKAKQMLDAAGWTVGPDGDRQKDGVKFRFPLLTNDDPARVRAAEEISRQLKPLGIRADVSASGYSGLIERFLSPRQFDAVLFGLDPGGDPDSYSNWHSSQAKPGGFNFVAYSNKRVDDILEQARTSPDPLKRMQLYGEFQNIFAEDAPSILLYYPLFTYAVDRQVNGVTLHLLFEPSDRFRSVSDWYVKTKRVMNLGMPKLP